MAAQPLVKMPDEVRDLIRHLHPALKQKVRLALTEIIAHPSRGKALRGELQGLRSLRVHKFRIIYRGARVIEIIAIGPRRSIYDETLRLLHKEGPQS